MFISHTAIQPTDKVSDETIIKIAQEALDINQSPLKQIFKAIILYHDYDRFVKRNMIYLLK